MKLFQIMTGKNKAIKATFEDLSKDLTLLFIGHRITSLKICAQIVELCDDGIKRVGIVKDIINKEVYPEIP
jgi:hypothetical protein